MPHSSCSSSQIPSPIWSTTSSCQERYLLQRLTLRRDNITTLIVQLSKSWNTTSLFDTFLIFYLYLWHVDPFFGKPSFSSWPSFLPNMHRNRRTAQQLPLFGLVTLVPTLVLFCFGAGVWCLEHISSSSKSLSNEVAGMFIQSFLGNMCFYN